MKKNIKIIFLGLIAFICIGRVFAFDTSSISVNEDIYIKYDDMEKAEVVTLPSGYITNNPSIEYQFISLSEDQVKAFYETDDFKRYQSCVADVAKNYDFDAENFEETAEFQQYNQEVDTRCQNPDDTLLVPGFSDDNWESKVLDGTDDAIYIMRVPTELRDNSYVIWIRAKDTSDAYIYSYRLNLNTENIDFGTSAGTSDDSKTTTTPGNTSKSVNTPNTLLSKSVLIPIIGVLCLGVGAIVIAIINRKKTNK